MSFDEAFSLTPALIPNVRRGLVSRDEMNLAEFPLTVLSTRASPEMKTLEFSDCICGKSGELIERKWIITGADKFGLPTASDDEVLLGLLKLSVDNGFQSRKIFFTRYELLRILRWTTEGRSYGRLQKALDRLSGVRIKASNAFYDNEAKSHSTKNFGIIDEYEINDGRSVEPKPSFFTWSDVIFKSFQVGFIKKLDLDFYLDLQSAVSKRVYRFLDKHFWYKSKVQMNLFILAHEKVGVSRNYQYASSLRQQLDPAFEELQEKGFISAFEYEGRGKETIVSIWSAGGQPRSKLGSQKQNSSGGPLTTEKRTEGNAGENSGRTPQREQSIEQELLEALVERGIRDLQAAKLVHKREQAELQRMKEIISYFDKLCASRSHLVSRSPTGFLYRAVEKPFSFTLPGELAQQSLWQNAAHGSSNNGRGSSSGNRGRGGTGTNRELLEGQYLIERKREIQRLLSTVEPKVLKEIEKEVEAALANVRKIISADKFQETVRHGVEEKLIKLFQFPDFHEWSTKFRKAGTR